MTNKPIAFLPFSFQSPPSLCRREAGEKEKRTGKRAKHDGKGKEIRAISIFFFFFAFLLRYPVEPLRWREASNGLEVGRLGCQEAPIVTNIV